jgi:murein DD-endopeptidase MepM/ murein hydrolase activator NlpD
MKPFVDFSTYNGSNPFGAVDPKFYPATKHHIGSDFKVPIGTPIVAPEDGEMFKAIFNSARGNTGIYVFRHGAEWGVEFCHLRELPPLKTYKRGEVIAYSGNTGSATTAPHLHVTLHKDAMVSKNYAELTSEGNYLRLCKEGRIVDPYAWFKAHLLF